MPASPYRGRGLEHLALWMKRLAEPSFAYVIQAKGSIPIKVGFAHDVTARIATLQTGNHAELRLLHVLPGDARLEWFLHQRLVGDRIRGEWFDGRKVPAFLRYVADLADRMLAEYDGSGKPPSYADLDPKRLREHPKKWKNPVTVRYVEPNPKVPREVAEEMRRSVLGCSRDLYLGPANSIVRSRTPGEAKNGGHW